MREAQWRRDEKRGKAGAGQKGAELMKKPLRRYATEGDDKDEKFLTRRDHMRGKQYDSCGSDTHEARPLVSEQRARGRDGELLPEFTDLDGVVPEGRTRLSARTGRMTRVALGDASSDDETRVVCNACMFRWRLKCTRKPGLPKNDPAHTRCPACGAQYRSSETIKTFGAVMILLS